MLESIYIGESGLVGYSRGLSSISNNVANLNTPGFKGSTLNFSDLFYQFKALGGNHQNGSELSFGQGLNVSGSTVLFKQGELRQTGNDQDAAIDGGGFFVLRREHETFYTRSGEFQFDPNGFLVSRATGDRVAGLGAGQSLVDINIGGMRTSAPRQTSTVSFVGNLSTNDADNTQVISNVSVFDAAGGSHALRATFTNNNAVTPRSWLVAIADDTGANIANGEIRFQGDGSPLAGFNSIAFTYNPPGTASVPLTFTFGEPGNFSGATNFSAGPDSTLAVGVRDGLGVGGLTKVTIDATGFVIINYSNGQTFKAAQLALAAFDFAEGLEQIGGSIFANRTGQKVRLGVAETSVFGRISGGSLEGSNVDLATEFSELIVMQRGFQASSQIISTANEMIQQLFDVKSSR